MAFPGLLFPIVDKAFRDGRRRVEEEPASSTSHRREGEPLRKRPCFQPGGPCHGLYGRHGVQASRSSDEEHAERRCYKAVRQD